MRPSRSVTTRCTTDDSTTMRVVAGQQNGSSLSRQRFENVEELLRQRRVEVGGRLVGDDHFRVVDQGAGDGDALLLAARQPFDAGRAAVAELERVQQGFGALRAARASRRRAGTPAA